VLVPRREPILQPIGTPVTDALRAAPPGLHGGGAHYFGLAWPALEWLEQTVRPGMATLETGCGASSIVFAAAGTDHTVVSPAADEHDAIRAWCAEHDIEAAGLTFLAESSDTALTGSWNPAPLDLVLVDGAHLFPFPALDWFNTARHLRVGGRVVLDDANLPSVNTVVRFLRSSPSWEFEGAISYRTVCFRKLDDEIGQDSLGTRFDRRARFNYLPPGQRVVAWGRHLLIDRLPFMQRALARRRR
jgi:hypothetical protein